MVHNSSTGVQALFTSTMSMNTSIIDLPNHYLPSECGYNNHRCGILHFEHNRYSYYIIPLIRSFVMLYHSVDYMDPELEMQKVFVNVSEECNPTRAFRVRANHVIIACMDLQSRSKETLYYLNYDLIFPSSTGSSLISRNTELPTKPETIYDPATVSDIIYVPEQTRCEQRDNLYFIDDTYAVRFPVRAFDPQFIPSSNALADCIDYQGFEYYGNDNLIIRCSNSRTALYDSCDTGLFTYPPHDQIPYPCSNWNNVIVYRNGTQLSLNRDGDSVTQQLPFNDISFGRCVQRTDHPVFIASSADGAIFITHFNGNNFTKITSGNCSNINNGACPRPIFSENEHVFGIFDSKTGNFVIVNVTEGCLENPVIAQIPIPIVPPLVSVSLSQRSYNCSCSPMQNNELPSTTQTESTPEATQTESVSESITMQTNDAGQTKFTTTTNPSESTSFPTDSSTSTSHHQPYSNTSSISNEGLLAGVLTVAVVLSLASILIL